MSLWVFKISLEETIAFSQYRVSLTVYLVFSFTNSLSEEFAR